MSKKQESTHNKRAVKRCYVFILCVVISILLFDIFTPVAGGQIKNYASWLNCGGRPYQSGSAINSYVNYYELSPVFTVFRDNRVVYFCTPREAELAGYSASMKFHNYPHMTKEELETRTDERLRNVFRDR